MKALCGLDVDKDRVHISFAHLKNNNPVFIEEVSLEIPFADKTFLQFLQENSNAINQKICEREKALSLNIEKIYINLPWDTCKQGAFSAIIPLSKRKKITYGDIAFAKKYLQDTYLDWDDSCIHNFILSYESEGGTYKTAPLGVIAKKIKISAFLVWIKDKLNKDTDEVFDNLERSFGGFVFPAASILSTIFSGYNSMDNSCIVIDVGYDKTFMIVVKDKKISNIKEATFGLKAILDELEKKFLLPKKLTEEVFGRYISFKELSHLKEVSMKNGENYVNLSTQAANSFVREYIKNEIRQIIEGVKAEMEPNCALYLCGRLNAKEGFYEFLKDVSINPLGAQHAKETVSKSFGALRYGVTRFLENDSGSNNSFLSRILNIYKEYF